MNDIKFKPKLDKTTTALMIILALVIGMSIGSYIFNLKTAHGQDINLGKLVTGTVLGTPTFIGVSLSETCIKLVKQNQSDSCPSYKDLIPFDNTNQQISGKFVWTNGFYHRLMSHTQFHYQMYKSDQTIIMIDPDAQAMSYGKNIIIVPKGFTYTLSTTNNSINNTRIMYVDRYVDASCKLARISYSASLLNDTINYMKNNCSSTSTKFNEQQKFQVKEHQTNPKDTAIYKYQQWLKQAKQQATKNCLLKKCDIQDTRWK